MLLFELHQRVPHEILAANRFESLALLTKPKLADSASVDMLTRLSFARPTAQSDLPVSIALKPFKTAATTSAAVRSFFLCARTMKFGRHARQMWAIPCCAVDNFHSAHRHGGQRESYNERDVTVGLLLLRQTLLIIDESRIRQEERARRTRNSQLLLSWAVAPSCSLIAATAFLTSSSRPSQLQM